jgi:hypothetical protein
MQSATNWDERMRDARFAPGVYSIAAISQRSRYKSRSRHTSLDSSFNEGI